MFTLLYAQILPSFVGVHLVPILAVIDEPPAAFDFFDTASIIQFRAGMFVRAGEFNPGSDPSATPRLSDIASNVIHTMRVLSSSRHTVDARIELKSFV